MKNKKLLLNAFKSGKLITITPILYFGYTNPFDRQYSAKYSISLKMVLGDIEEYIPEFYATSDQEEWEAIGAWEVMIIGQLIYAGNNLRSLKDEIRSDWGYKASEKKYTVDKKFMNSSLLQLAR